MPPPLPIPKPAQNNAFNFDELLGSRFTALNKKRDDGAHELPIKGIIHFTYQVAQEKILE